jgi:hypothetical protein
MEKLYIIPLIVNRHMKSFYFNNGIKVTIPDNWKEEKGDNLVSIYDPVDGAGALQFSFYKASNPDSIDLSKKLEEYLHDKHESTNIKQLPGCAYCSLVDEDEIYWRYWLFLKLGDVVFASYNCHEAIKDQEYRLIDNIVKSLI